MQVNPLLADRARLAILVVLASAKSSDFMALLERLELSKGNLSSHLRKLEDGGLISVTKEFVDRRPKSTYTLTKLGRSQLENYLREVELALTQMRGK